MDPLTALAALAPLGVELGKGLISRFIAPDAFKPATIEQWARMRELDLAQFKAMGEAGGAQPSYPWVEAVVRMQRPAVAACVLGVWGWCSMAGTITPGIENFACAVGFYLFGDRTLFYARKGASK